MNLVCTASLISGLVLLMPFPLYALVMGRHRRLPTPPPPVRELASISVIVVARDAADLIEARLRNLLAQDYPADRIEIIVYTDGCRDDTAARARAVSPSIRVIEGTVARGKIHGMNRAAEQAGHELLVFSDADAHLAPQALRGLARYFADPAVGGVCGRRVIADDTASALGRAQSGYIDLDSRIKLAETRTGSITSNDGKLYAVRAGLYEPLPDAVTDDLYVAMNVVRQNHRFLFAPEIPVAVELPARDLAHELTRRRRIVSTSLRGIWRMRELLNPFKHGGYALRLFLNKVMRRLLPLGLLPLALAACISAPLPMLYLLLATGLLLNARPCLSGGPLGPTLDTLAYLGAGLLGTLGGLLDLVRGRTPISWRPRKQGANSSAPRVAYTMSRFPKITETFVLYEILELQRTGMEVNIFPLLLERENTRHPEVSRMMHRVYFSPFLNLAVVRANLCWLTGSPWRFIRAWASALYSAWPNPNFVIGALGVLPKAAHYAQQMQQQGIGHLHAHFATHPALAARFIHSLTDIPYSFTAHGHDIHIALRGFDAKARDARFWVTVSRYNLHLIAKAFGPELLENAYLVHCGIDLQQIAMQPPPDNAGRLTILCVASFKEVKGHRYLIDACKRLRQRGNDFHCRLIGDGPLRAQIEQYIRTAGLLDYFTLEGQRSRPAVLDAMRDSDVVVLPSILASRGDREGIPVCLMEAMATGRPVVSSELSGIPELVSSGVEGILVPQRDSEALAEALVRLGGDPAMRARMGCAGRSKVARLFDLAANTAQLAALLRQSLATGPMAGRVHHIPVQRLGRSSRKAS